MLCKGKDLFLPGKEKCHLFYIISPFFLRNQNIRCIFAERICRKVDGSQKAVLKT